MIEYDHLAAEHEAGIRRSLEHHRAGRLVRAHIAPVVSVQAQARIAGAGSWQIPIRPERVRRGAWAR